MTNTQQPDDLQRFMAAYAPERQAALTADKEACFLGNAPTLAAVAARYGRSAAQLWVAGQLNDLTRFAGCSKLSSQQILATAEVIAAMHSRLKLTELMYFFLHLKGGEWGGYYGLGNGMQVTSALAQFLAARVRIIDALERERADREAERQRSQRRGCTYDEYLQWRRANGMGEPDHSWLRDLASAGSNNAKGGAA